MIWVVVICKKKYDLVYCDKILCFNMQIQLCVQCSIFGLVVWSMVGLFGFELLGVFFIVGCGVYCWGLKMWVGGIVVYIIVVGNEKGGLGKLIMLMYVVMVLVWMGYWVGVLDLDVCQCSFGCYFENWVYFVVCEGLDLLMLCLGVLEVEIEGVDLLLCVVEVFEVECDFILLDCFGLYIWFSQMVYSLVDMLIMLMNDSFIDFDLLVWMLLDGWVLGLLIYVEMVWGVWQLCGEVGVGLIDWLVLCNWLGMQVMYNKCKVGGVLLILLKCIGFCVVLGFFEWVIFCELFLCGLMLLDLKDIGIEQLSILNIVVWQELCDLIGELKLLGVSVVF